MNRRRDIDAGLFEGSIQEQKLRIPACAENRRKSTAIGVRGNPGNQTGAEGDGACDDAAYRIKNG